MDSFQRAQCINTFEELMHSDLAKCVDDFFGTEENRELIFPINFLRQKIEENEYSQADDFIDDVKSVFLKTAKSLGPDSEISLVIETLLKQFLDDARSLTEYRSDDFLKKIEIFSQKLKDLLPTIPDNLHEFQILFDKAETKPLLEEFHTKVTEKQFEKKEINVNSLYNALKRLPDDQDVTNVIDLITKYEFIVPEDPEQLDVDMSKFHPYTLKVLQDYIDKKKKKKK